MGAEYQPIENYGVIGNMRTAALVGIDGSIDWLCLPHFDSPSVFAALLDDRKGGRFRIAPAGDEFRRKQFYWPDTAILVTRFLHEQGVGEIEDWSRPSPAPAAPIRRAWKRHVCSSSRCSGTPTTSACTPSRRAAAVKPWATSPRRSHTWP